MDERLRSFYDDKYRNPSIENDGVVGRTARVRFPRDRYEALTSFFVPCDRVLDIGAGAAFEIQLLRPLCRQITVTEISEIRAARITETYSGDPDVSVILHILEEGPGPLRVKCSTRSS